MLLMAFNPCPCGWLGSKSRPCRCDDGQARRYAGRLSGPLRDRMDLWVRAEEPREPDLDGAEPSGVVAARVRAAWRRQLDRQGMANGELFSGGADRSLELSPRLVTLLQRRGAKFRLSPRRLHRASRVARTIADLDGCPELLPEHVDEALHYRPEAAA
jgi:magnesium chelatase family protein